MVCFLVQVTVHSGVNPGRNLDGGTKAEITQERQFLACFPWITQFVVGTQGPLLRDAGTTVG